MMKLIDAMLTVAVFLDMAVAYSHLKKGDTARTIWWCTMALILTTRSLG
ncbi:hypothetical protein K413DRAFT_1185 [Clostridium sp. ASBs410]|nr:hypothetical protein K413DRAFT_1185 [Clostridium sp. ASBs410]